MRGRRISATALANVLLVTSVSLASPQLATASPTAVTSKLTASSITTKYCKGKRSHTRLIKDLNRGITTNLKKYKSVKIRIAFKDRTTGVQCLANSNTRTFPRSIIKVTLLASLLYKNKVLTPTQERWANDAIIVSSNSAAHSLWRATGKAAGMKRFFKAAGMTKTKPHPGMLWGNAQVTAGDQLKLMRLLTDGSNRVLSRENKNYILDLMNRVKPAQRKWGISAGLTPESTEAIKNGWGESEYEPGWWINSIGSIRNGNHHYQIALITNRHKKMRAGIKVIDAVASAINKSFTKHP